MTSTPPSSTPTPQSDGTLQFGEWGRVTEQTATRPTDVRSTDRVVFRHPYDDDVVWEATDGRQFLLVQVERRITDAPDDELVAYPARSGIASPLVETRTNPVRAPTKPTRSLNRSGAGTPARAVPARVRRGARRPTGSGSTSPPTWRPATSNSGTYATTATPLSGSSDPAVDPAVTR